MLSVECSEENVPLSHGIARYRTPDKSGFRIFASWFRKRAKSLAQLEKNISLIGKIKRPEEENEEAQENKRTTTILSRQGFSEENKSNENKTPSLETSRFAKYFF